MKGRGFTVALIGALVLGLAPVSAAQDAPPRRGWLGFSYEAGEWNGASAVRIAGVYPGSPAAAAGMRNGDQIVRWNGSGEVVAALESLRLEPGDTVRLRIRRENERDRDLLVVAASRPRDLAMDPRERRGELFGVAPGQWEKIQRELRESQEEVARMFGENARSGALRADSLGRVWRERFRVDSLAVHADSLHRGIQLMLRDSLGPHLRALNDHIRLLVPEGTSRTVIALGRRSVAGAEFEEMNEGLASYFGTDEGALVLRVSPGTPAARAGLQPGDVVLQADDREVNSVEDLRSVVARAQGLRTRAVRLEILRRGEHRRMDLSWE